MRMTGFENSKWHEECFGHCGVCISCLHLANTNEGSSSALSTRFVTVGSVRYGVRLGAVSPPPPGAGPRYRTQCCWPSTSSPGLVSRIPLLATPAINNSGIFRCVNRMRMAEDDTSEVPEKATVHSQVLHTTKSLKNQLRRRAIIRPQIYARLCECGDGEGADIFNTLDRLPRFRFGGNRNNSIAKDREREKRTNDLRLKEITERLKRVPPRNVVSRVPPCPVATASQTPEESAVRTVPLRSASFSQVDYSTDDKKYVRRRCPVDETHLQTKISQGRAILTLPRSKNSSIRPATVNTENQNPLTANDDETVSTELSNDLTSIEVEKICEIIYHGYNDEKNVEPLHDVTTVDSAGLQNTDCRTITQESVVKDCEPNNTNSNAQENKRDKSRRRKGMYISQWPNSYQSSEDIIPQFVEEGKFVSCENSIADLPKLKVSCESWSKSFEEPSSPVDNPTDGELCKLKQTNRPPLSTQSSEEKDIPLSHLGFKGNQLLRADSLSESEIEHSRDQQILSDISDCDARSTTTNSDSVVPHIARRYSKRPLRGPYGQMLEAEMKKPEADRKQQYSNDLKFLDDITGHGVSLSCSNSVGAGDPRPKYINRIRGSSNLSLDDSQLKTCLNNLNVSDKVIPPMSRRKVSTESVTQQGINRNEFDQKPVVSHQRTISSPSKLEALVPPSEASNELLEHLLRGSSEQLATSDNLQRSNDTRTHVVVELFDTEHSYVESLQILISKYLEPLKSSDNAGLLDVGLVDEIFFQIPSLLSHHQVFLEELRRRLEHWDMKQKVGDVFLETFSKPAVIECYTNYVNNWKRARDIIKNAQQTKPAFAKFLENTAREHKGKLALDSLLIKPIQKFPKYELLLQRLIKHTDITHPDHSLLMSAQREVHEQLLKINCTEREALELEQLREIEGIIEGLIELVAADRQYIRHDFVSMAAGGGTRKERALFLFSDLLLVTSIKRKSGTIRKPASGQGSVTSTLDANKYKLLMKISLDDLEIVKARDESLKQMMTEIENLTEDISILNQVTELTWTLHCNHTALDEIIKEMYDKLNKQLTEQQNSDSQLSCLDLTLNTSNGLENVSIVFSKAEKRASWEESFSEAKHKLAMSGVRRPCPELIAAVPIRKTRAGLHFTCAAPAVGDNRRNVWVGNSDGFVGQVCVLSLQPEPNVTSCNGVCNARILSIASVPGVSSAPLSNNKNNSRAEVQDEHATTIQFDSSSSSDDDDRSDSEEFIEPNRRSAAIRAVETASTDSEEGDNQQCTMWLGTADGYIHVYNSGDNVRMKKNKIKLQYGFAVLCIIYLENKVYIALANGDIIIYEREGGGWGTGYPTTVTVGTKEMPVSKMFPSSGKLWCGCGNTVKIFNTETLETENTIVVNNDNKPITCVILSGNALWLSMQNSAIVKCFHTISFELLCEINVAPAVTKMLTSFDDIIRQHKAACLRVTALLVCKDLLWIGTSAGVLLTMSLPHISPSTTKLNNVPCLAGVPQGHTGHVRFLTTVEYQTPIVENIHHRYSYKGKPEQRNNLKLLVISGGDGYEDFRGSTEVAGREDSTNHLLLWSI